jgi:hypothetical protein
MVPIENRKRNEKLATRYVDRIGEEAQVRSPWNDFSMEGLGRRSVHIGFEYFHHARRIDQLAEFELLVQAMCIFGAEHETSQTLQVFVILDDLHKPLGQAFASMSLKNKYIGEVRKRRFVRDHTGEPNLLVSSVQAEAQGVAYRSLDHRARNARRPVALREKRMNDRNIKQLGLGGYLVLAERGLG